MANEANSPEELLKQYAAHRRQQVPPEVHPATRNLLQGEVRRTYVSPEQEQRARLGIRWLRALAWVAILAVIPMFLMPRNPTTKNDTERAMPSKPSEVTLPTASAPSGSSIVLSDTAAPVPPPATMPAKEAPALAAAAPHPVVRDEARSRSADTVAIQQGALADAAKKVEAAAAVNELNVNVLANNRLSFANNISTPQALNRFQLEEEAARVRLIEADGSVYSGPKLKQQVDNYSFRVAGTNRTLRQQVVLTGQVMRAPMSLARQQTFANSAQNTLDANNLRNFSNNNNSNSNFTPEDVRVQGQGTIGSSQIKVDAQMTPGP